MSPGYVPALFKLGAACPLKQYGGVFPGALRAGVSYRSLAYLVNP